MPATDLVHKQLVRLPKDLYQRIENARKTLRNQGRSEIPTTFSGAFRAALLAWVQDLENKHNNGQPFPPADQ